MVRRVLIFGHSFVRRLGDFTFDYRDFGWLNLGLDGTEVQVDFYGLGGGTLRPGPKCVQRREHMSFMHDYSVCFLQIGGNDLSSESDPKKLARDIVSFSDYIIHSYEMSHVIIGQLLPRYSEWTEEGYNVKVVDVNKHVEKMTSDKTNITFWHHRGLWKDTHEFLLKDKVHLNDEGMVIYAKSVRAAVGSPSRS